MNDSLSFKILSRKAELLVPTSHAVRPLGRQPAHVAYAEARAKAKSFTPKKGETIAFATVFAVRFPTVYRGIGAPPCTYERYAFV